MDRNVSVRTPESIAFSYELAGLGSRFLALAADMAIQTLVLAGIFWAIILIGTHQGIAVHETSGEARVTQSLGTAIVIAILFIVYFGYFILFEAFWNGQTPGKKMLGLRVVRDGGYPIEIGSALIRNLIRVGEAALAFYAVSAISTILSPENKRLGDLAAGTIVVRDGRAPSLASIVAEAAPASPNRVALSPQEHALVDRYVARRDSLTASKRALLASEIAQRFRSRLPHELQSLDDDALLGRLSAWQ